MIPRIHGLTACVGFGSSLYLALPRWLPQLASLTVVSTGWDATTRLVCQQYAAFQPTPIRLHCTDAFTLHGASFNKGLAMEEARAHMPWQDWILFFDADVVPPPDWSDCLSDLHPGFLYGCRRYDAPNLRSIGCPNLPLVPDDRVGYGYFQLFHSRHPLVQRRPLLDTCWKHAGNYDSNFLLSFQHLVRELPLRLWHLGDTGQWFGVGKKDEMEQLMRMRAGRGIQDSEKIDIP